MKILQILALGSVLGASLVLAQAPPTSTSTSTPTKTTTTKATPKAPVAPPTAAEIADAKAKGLVWANLNTKVYHKSTDKEYGTTKNGKFMSEADAQKAGYRLAKDMVKKAAAATAPAKTN